MRTVLVSVSDKTGLENFLRRLERFDTLKLIATGNTYKFLEEKGFKCLKVEELTQFPEILSGRVKTLHPKVFAGILARPSTEDRNTLAEMDILEIDVVVVNLYPFEKKLKENLTEPEMVEQIDIGGVTLLRAAAKNFERVTVVSDPAQYDYVVSAIDGNKGEISLDLRKELAFEAFRRTAQYDLAISGYLGTRVKGAPESSADTSTMPASLSLSLTRHEPLRYGENPHQAAGWYAPATINTLLSEMFPPFEQLQGKELSANNIMDTYSLLQILRDIDAAGACIIKHNNPCGVALNEDMMKAYEIAYQCDPISAFGGIYGFTRKVDDKLAAKVIENFIEIIAAPEFTPEAVEVFKKKKNVRVLKLKPEVLKKEFVQSFKVRDLQSCGFLVEQDVEAPVKVGDFKCVTEKQLDKSRVKDVEFAWNVVKHLTSNAIFVARNGQSLGFGVGQTNRVGSVRLALTQAGANAKGAVLASDAFFPATDNIEEAARAGIGVIVQPGGSIKDDEVIAACNKAGMVMLFTGQRCFRH